MFFPGQFTLSQSSPPMRNAMYLRAFFYRIYLCLSRDFVNKHVFFAARFTFRQPKLPVGNATNLRTFRFITPFKRLFVLRDSLIRSLYFIQVYIFIPLIHSAQFLRFSHILLYTNFSWCILPRKIFFLSLMTLFL